MNNTYKCCYCGKERKKSEVLFMPTATICQECYIPYGIELDKHLDRAREDLVRKERYLKNKK